MTLCHDARRVQIVASALAAVAADAEERCANARPRPVDDAALYPVAYDPVAEEWGTAPALVHLAHESAPVPGRLAYLAALGIEEGNETLLALADEWCGRLLGRECVLGLGHDLLH